MWYATAPSNIALIKYMGKLNPELNIPINSSLSYTLTNLQTEVRLSISEHNKDLWQPLGTKQLSLSEAAKLRFLKHLKFIKDLYKINECFLVESNNNFPHSAGLASSASSFAALTKATFLAIQDLKKIEAPNINEQANLSRQGSGSSCRSFFEPWALWEHDRVTNLDLPYKNLIHKVIIVNSKEKTISSGLAHSIIKSSPHYKTRPLEAQKNLQNLLESFAKRDWEASYKICWREFEALHQLFETSEPYFSYKTQATNIVLALLEEFWQTKKDGPIVTMDAGPNIHLLYREDQADLALDFEENYLRGFYNVL